MTQYILSLSYGKDSLACLGAIEKLGLPLDRIVHAEVWATDTIPADLPPMVEFKRKADEIIKRRFGIEVEHIYAMDKTGNKQTYEKIFYRTPTRTPGGKFKEGSPAGFPYTKGAWCNDRLKTNPLDSIAHTPPPNRIYGFPMRKGNWCNSDLKMAPLRKSQGLPAGGHSIAPGNSRKTQSESFPEAPYHRGLTKILWCNTWELRLTNPKELNGIPVLVSSFPW